MNDATNAGGIEAVDLAGDTRLTSVQRASGSVAAIAVSTVAVGSGWDAIGTSRLTVQGNSAASEATANRALNSLSVASVTGLGGTPVLDNRQGNDAGVLSATNATFTVTGRGASASAIPVESNTASSLARGNVADSYRVASRRHCRRRRGATAVRR